MYGEMKNNKLAEINRNKQRDTKRLKWLLTVCSPLQQVQKNTKLV